MIKVKYPEKHPSIKKEGDRELIFCICRRRWVILTPEEWVRQNFLLYLTEVLSYPAKLIAVEKAMKVGELNRRFDIVVYNVNAHPKILVECKEMNVPLSDKTMMQMLAYNSGISAEIIAITNGAHCIAFRTTNGQVEELTCFPKH